MKKSIFILAALFAATISNAQITLEKTFKDLTLGTEIQIVHESSYQSGSIFTGYFFPTIYGSYFAEVNVVYNGNSEYSIIDIYDSRTFALIKTFNTADMMPPTYYHIGFISRGIFTTDNKWAWLYANSSNLFVVTEDHTELLHVNYYDAYPYIIKVGDQYKLVVPGVQQGDSYVTQLYSLPGKGDSGQDISTPVAPRNSRKVLKKDQVLVENADRTYTLQGQEVK